MASAQVSIPVKQTIRAALPAVAKQVEETASDTATLCRWLASHGLTETAGPAEVLRAVAATLRETGARNG